MMKLLKHLKRSISIIDKPNAERVLTYLHFALMIVGGALMIQSWSTESLSSATSGMILYMIGYVKIEIGLINKGQP